MAYGLYHFMDELTKLWVNDTEDLEVLKVAAQFFGRAVSEKTLSEFVNKLTSARDTLNPQLRPPRFRNMAIIAGDFITETEQDIRSYLPVLVPLFVECFLF